MTGYRALLHVTRSTFHGCEGKTQIIRQGLKRLADIKSLFSAPNPMLQVLTEDKPRRRQHGAIGASRFDRVGVCHCFGPLSP